MPGYSSLGTVSIRVHSASVHKISRSSPATVGPPHFAVRGALPPAQRFVVATVDPDAPTPQDPTEAQIRHFLAGNFARGTVTGPEQREIVNETVPLSGWLQPTPPAGSPAHRYVSVLSGCQVMASYSCLAQLCLSSFRTACGLQHSDFRHSEHVGFEL